MGNSFTSCVIDECFVEEDIEVVDTHHIDETNIRRQIVWEFQRYNDATGWGGSKENLLPSDPGRWSTASKSKFGESLVSVAPLIPPGYCVDLGWAIVVQKPRAVGPGAGSHSPQPQLQPGVTDMFGWHYAPAFDSKVWYNEHRPGCDVRRRAWRRLLIPISELERYK
jgi:hypothetical protein